MLSDVSAGNNKYIIDLFCGSGGVTTGFTKAGFTCLLAIDCWEKALKVHEKNHPNSLHLLKKLGDENDEESLNHDKLLELINNVITKNEKASKVHIHASPPCQNLSSINTNRTNCLKMTRWILDFFMNIIPKSWTWTIEQVSHPLVKSLLADQDNVFSKTIDMSLYGVSQNRKRMIASNVDIFDKLELFKEQTPLRKVVKVPENAVYIANGWT